MMHPCLALSSSHLPSSQKWCRRAGQGSERATETTAGMVQLLHGEWLTRQELYSLGGKKKNNWGAIRQKSSVRDSGKLSLPIQDVPSNELESNGFRTKRGISLHKAYSPCVIPFHGMQWTDVDSVVWCGFKNRLDKFMEICIYLCY